MNKRRSIGLIILITMCMLAACGNDAGNSEELGTNNGTNSSEIESVESEQDSSEIVTEDGQTETPSGDNNTTEKPSTEDVTTETPSTEDTTTEKPSGDQPSTEKPSTEKPSGNTSNNQKPSTGNSTTQKPATQTELSALVKKIVAEIIKPGMSELEKAVVIHDYLTYNIDYDYANYKNGTVPGSSHSSYGALTTKKAVCDGYAGAYYELAKEAGLDVKFVSGAADNGSGKGYQGHAWNQVKVDGVWYNLDACWGDPTYEGKDPADNSMNNYSYCLISDSVMYKDHRPDSNDVAKCPNSIDATQLAKAIAKTNTNEDMVYVSSIAEINSVVKNMAAAGKDEYIILTVDDGTDYWQSITDALRSTKKPLWISMGSQANKLHRHHVEIKEDVRCVETVAEFKKALDEYQGRWDKLELWYYNDTINDDNARLLVNEMLYRTGHVVEVYGMTEVRGSNVACTLNVPERVLTVNNIDELVAFTKQNGTNALLSQYIWCKRDNLDLSKLLDDLREKFVSEGIFIERIEDYGERYADVIKFYVTDLRYVTYMKDVQALKKYVDEFGIMGVVNLDIYTIKKNTNANAYDALYDFFVQAQCPVDYAYCEYNNVLCATVGRVLENTYITLDAQDLKDDINDAISKSMLGDVEFQFIDRTGQYSEADIRTMVEATGCGVVLDSYWTREGYFHSLRIRKVS